jgi:exodeoxyribonuclease VII small subunit
MASTDSNMNNDGPAAQSLADRSFADRSFADRSFESLVEELESVAKSMDSGDLGIEQTTDLYERARLLHAAAHERLAKVRGRLDELAADGSEHAGSQ